MLRLYRWQHPWSRHFKLMNQIRANLASITKKLRIPKYNRTLAVTPAIFGGHIVRNISHSEPHTHLARLFFL
jgi:hypothetical protein